MPLFSKMSGVFFFVFLRCFLATCLVGLLTPSQVSEVGADGEEGEGAGEQRADRKSQVSGEDEETPFHEKRAQGEQDSSPPLSNDKSSAVNDNLCSPAQGGGHVEEAAANCLGSSSPPAALLSVEQQVKEAVTEILSAVTDEVIIEAAREAISNYRRKQRITGKTTIGLKLAGGGAGGAATKASASSPAASSSSSSFLLNCMNNQEEGGGRGRAKNATARAAEEEQGKGGQASKSPGLSEEGEGKASSGRERRRRESHEEPSAHGSEDGSTDEDHSGRIFNADREPH